jgi:hypothetical protein
MRKALSSASRALPGIRAARLTWFNPFTSRLRKVSIQIVVAAVPGQEASTRDNVTLRVGRLPKLLTAGAAPRWPASAASSGMLPI